MLLFDSFPESELSPNKSRLVGIAKLAAQSEVLESKRAVEYFEIPWLLKVIFGTDPAHHPLGPVKIWIHPAVPATGVVKMEFPSGSTLELLDFGP